MTPTGKKLSHTHISYSLCKFWEAIMKNDGCFLLTPMLNFSNDWPIENGVLGVRYGRINCRGKMTPLAKTCHQNTFLGGFCVKPVEATLLMVSCSVGVLKELKIFFKKHMTWQLHLYPRPRPFGPATMFLHVGRVVDNHFCQISRKSVPGYGPRWRKSPFSVD